MAWPPPVQKRTLRRKCKLEKGHAMLIAKDKYGQDIRACVLCGQR